MKSFVLKFAFIFIAFFSIWGPSFADDKAAETVHLALVVSSSNEVNINAVKLVVKGISAMDAISELVVVETKETSYGSMIMSVAGVEAVGSNYWALYVDGKMSIVGAQEVVLDEDTFIRLNLEPF
jgi:hypothetical protein